MHEITLTLTLSRRTGRGDKSAYRWRLRGGFCAFPVRSDYPLGAMGTRAAISSIEPSRQAATDLLRAPSAVTLRSIFLGTLLSALIAGLAPYNDFVVGNGFLIACYLPVGFMLCMFVLVIGVNTPLRRWAPGWALSSGDYGGVGVGGLATAGGIGWLVRRDGFAPPM